MSTFLTADTHFGHSLMLRLPHLPRPFETVDEMDEALIKSWNNWVHPRDTAWHLGDFAMGHTPERVAEIFNQLNGIKRLILGNHDVDKKGRPLPTLTSLEWASISHAAEITHDGQRIILGHYAPYVWNQAHRGAYAAFGHSHGTIQGLPGTIDVGVDAQGLRPISVSEFILQAENSIINAPEIVDTINSRLNGMKSGWQERADAIMAAREEEANSTPKP